MAKNNSVINSVAVIGAGTMGRGIAYLLALNGIRTLLYNRNGHHLNQARDYIVRDLDKKIVNGKISHQKKGEVLANLVFSPIFDAIADSDLVIETIAEHEQTKHQILTAIADTVKKEAIIEHDNQRKHLLAIIDHLKFGLRAAGIPLVSEDSHILPIRIGDPHRNKHISKQLLDEYDIYVQPVNAPAEPAGSERLCVTPTSAHTHEDVEYFLAALSKVWAANELRRAG